MHKKALLWNFLENQKFKDVLEEEEEDAEREEERRRKKKKEEKFFSGT